MTRKDYELIASCINKAKATWTAENQRLARVALSDVALTIGSALELENDRFKLVKFLEACDYQVKDK